MSKHEHWELKQMQALPLELKIRKTKARIQEWYEYWDGMVYVSFSGGKDSTVLKHIVDQMYDGVPSLFVNTGLEYPEIQKFARSQKNVITVRPKMRFDEVILEKGYPIISKDVASAITETRGARARGNYGTAREKQLMGTLLRPDGKKSSFNKEKWKFLLDADFLISDECCAVMKKRPAHKYAKESGRKAIVGTMASESRTRKSQWMRQGCNAFDAKEPSSKPLSFWTEQDILQYLKLYNVKYCKEVYGDIVEDLGENEFDGQTTMSCLNPKLKTTGASRTGCIFCGFGCHLENDPNRFQKLKKTHPKQWEYCMGGGEYVDGMWMPNKEGLGMRKVLDYIDVKYE